MDSRHDAKMRKDQSREVEVGDALKGRIGEFAPKERGRLIPVTGKGLVWEVGSVERSKVSSNKALDVLMVAAHVPGMNFRSGAGPVCEGSADGGPACDSIGEEWIRQEARREDDGE